ERLAVQGDGAPGHLHPRVTLGVELVDHFLVALEQHRVEAHVLMDADRRAAAARTGEQAKHAALVRIADRPLLVARLVAATVRHDPDLKKMHELALGGIELAVRDARAGAHPLHLAGPDHRARAEAVPVLQGALEHVADDLHVPMSVGREAVAGLHAVLVDHAQGAEPHVARIVVFAERKRVRGVEPAEVEMAAVGRGAPRDHSWVPVWPASLIRRSRSSSGSTYFSRHSGQIPCVNWASECPSM